MLGKLMDNVCEKKPLIHNITNYVTANDCANILLACKASPIMAEAEQEVEEVTSICDGLSINIGTLVENKIPAMLKAGKRANELGHPVVLDPVGAGVSEFRTKAAHELINQVHFDVIRGNLSEIRALVSGVGSSRGVDTDGQDEIVNDIGAIADFAGKVAGALDTIVVVSGATDIVADADRVYAVSNGHNMMSRVTGCGCMLSSITAAFLAANKEDKIEATLAAVCAMGVAGEMAHDRLTKEDGNATYRNYIIDAIYNMDGAKLEAMARYEVIK
ncbi:MAG: hydroxyethylthiazole kinase [Lachnospiraceae bacterium]|nr:hydroxyethylthiazole kinase [Lachnospiraceae bacterium]